MGLFMFSFHDLDEELGGCILRAATEPQALRQLRKGRFAEQVGFPAHGRALVTEMVPRAAALVPEKYVGRLLTEEEFDHLTELLLPAAVTLPGPALDAASAIMASKVNAEIRQDLNKKS